ncbi:MAG: TonB-dependent receptor [Gammaproteobacteria bacterium]|nr:TonB-dependent receptor [Gammaproteobacteria bacterium]MYF38619.1 TonB-dependent receptor [Gammaproteobacteria bacterium]
MNLPKRLIFSHDDQCSPFNPFTALLGQKLNSNNTLSLLTAIVLSSLGISGQMYGEEDQDSDDNEIEEVIVEKDQSYVEYSEVVNSVRMFGSPADVLKPISSLAFDNSIGQIRSRGSEANHIGIQIDGYDIADPVSDFNFASLSCTGIDLLHFSATPGSGSIGGVINLESSSDARRSINLAYGSAGDHAEFTYGVDQHNISISRKDWEGIDILGDGDLDGVEHVVGHYHFAGSNWQSTVRFASVAQGYDRGRAEIDQGLIGVTGVLLDRLNVRISSSLNRATWFESFNNNTTGTRTKLSLSTPIAEWLTWELDQVYDVNKSVVRGEPTRKPIGVNYLRAKYDQAYRQLSWNASLTRIDSSQDEPILSKSVHFAWLVENIGARESGLVVYFEFDHQTIAFPSMVDRYGWGQKWLPNPNVKPERGTGLSFGAKYSSATTTIQGTRFTTRLRDKISFGRNVSENIDYGRNRGIELLWRHTWNRQLSTNIAFSHLNSEARTGADQPYRQTERRPTNILAGTVYYTAASVSSNLTLRWVDEAVDRCWRGCLTLDAYLVVDGSLSYRWNDVIETSFEVFNLLDETYYHVYGYHTPGQQISIAVSLLLDR